MYIHLKIDNHYIVAYRGTDVIPSLALLVDIAQL